MSKTQNTPMFAMSNVCKLIILNTDNRHKDTESRLDNSKQNME